MTGPFAYRTQVCCLLLVMLLGYGAAQEPSLADVARQQRQHQKTKVKRVMTNEDLPHAPEQSKPQATSDSSEPDATAGAKTGANMLRQNVDNERYLTERIATLEKSLAQASDQAERDRINAALQNYQKALSENKRERKFLEEHVAKGTAPEEGGVHSTETEGGATGK